MVSFCLFVDTRLPFHLLIYYIVHSFLRRSLILISMRLGVIGSRAFSNYPQMAKYLAKKVPVKKIITGNSEGADTLVLRYAREHNIPFESYPKNMLDLINNSDLIIAFWDGKSPGTQSVLKFAKASGKKIEVVFLERKETQDPFALFVF